MERILCRVKSGFAKYQRLVRVSLTAPFEPLQFSDYISVCPTSINIKDEKGKYISKYKETSWNYELNSKSLDFEDVINDFLFVFKGKEDKILEFSQKHNVNADIVVAFYVYDSIVPALCLSKEFIRFLRITKCDFGFDGYIF